MKTAYYNLIGRTCAVAIAAAVSLTGATFMSAHTASAETAKEVVLEGRAAKTDRLDASNVKPEVTRDQKSEPLPLPSTAEVRARAGDQERSPGVIGSRGRKRHDRQPQPGESDEVPDIIYIEPGAGTEETRRNFADGRISKPRWQISKEGLDRFGRRVSYIWQLMTDTK